MAVLRGTTRPMWGAWVSTLTAALCAALLAGLPAHASREARDSRDAREGREAREARESREARAALEATQGAHVEARLQAIHGLMAAGKLREAQRQAEALVREVPNHQLGHLLLGDALSGQAGKFGAQAVMPLALRMSGTLGESLPQLRQEARLRLSSVQDRPPAGYLPSAFLALPDSIRHAIAIDASRHRLYLFERADKGLRMVADHYVSIGKLGMEKKTEGDQRTPVGVYFTTSRLDSHQLGDLYGSGALSLNYPNEVDRLKGRTGSGIWLHGTPAANYARPPLSTDGCIVLSNPDMARLMQAVAPQGTPVVISHRIDWIDPQQAERSSRGLGDALRNWWAARDMGDSVALAGFYASSATPMAEAPTLRRVSTRETDTTPRFQPPKDLSIFTWRDQFDHAVVTFGDVSRKARTGVVRRQFWAHDGQRWRIVHEAVLN